MTMQKIFRWTLYGFAAYFVLAFISTFVGVTAGEPSALYDMSLGLMVALICTSPFLVLTSLITGIGSYLQRDQDKKKKHDFMYGDFNESRMERIMSKLSPQDRAYLERRLADNEVGFGDDGELISMEDLLNEFEQKSKRDG